MAYIIHSATSTGTTTENILKRISKTTLKSASSTSSSSFLILIRANLSKSGQQVTVQIKLAILFLDNYLKFNVFVFW